MLFVTWGSDDTHAFKKQKGEALQLKDYIRKTQVLNQPAFFRV